MIRVTRHYPSEVRVGDDMLRILIKRLTVEEFDEFERQFLKNGRRGHKRVQKLKAAEKAEAEGKVLLDDEQQERIYEQSAQENKEAYAFFRQAISEYVSVPAGELFEEVDGADVPVTSGADLLRVLGTKEGFVSNLLALIYAENKLKESEKNGFRSRLASGSGSDTEPSQTADGSRPASTAGSAATSDTTSREDATGPSTARTDESSSTTAHATAG